MTIAACYLSSEGVVLGADSTSTIFVANPTHSDGSRHHYNFAQKVFEFGQSSTLGLVTWGLGGLKDISYRTLIAEVMDHDSAAAGMKEIVDEWISAVWSAYATGFSAQLKEAQSLAKQQSLTSAEQQQLGNLLALTVGFCIGGRWKQSRRPEAFEVVFTPLLNEKPAPAPITPGHAKFWGCPNLIQRLLYGIDSSLASDILHSGKWTGNQQDLFQLISNHTLGQPSNLPLRDAIDWVYSSIYATIKGMKFSHLPSVCGGPIEVAVVTTDRPFRWVRHKRLDEAIS